MDIEDDTVVTVVRVDEGFQPNVYECTACEAFLGIKVGEYRHYDESAPDSTLCWATYGRGHVYDTITLLWTRPG